MAAEPLAAAAVPLTPSTPSTPEARFGISRIFDYGNRFDLGIALTLLLLLLYSDRYWYIRIPLSVIAIGAFIFPNLRTSRALWGAALIIVAAGTYGNWYAVDNHKYLLGYWCLAIFLSLTTGAAGETLEAAARRMVVLVFGLSTLHKTLSPDYLDGAFFYYELMLDERFAGLARHVGGIPEHMERLNQAARKALVNFDSGLTAVELQGTAMAARLGTFMTWWNYLIQAVIALAFGLPPESRLGKTRHFWLLLFLFTTFLFAPVIGFGWVLAIMGIMQTGREEARTRVLYVVAFLQLQIYRTPWGALLSSLAGRDGP